MTRRETQSYAHWSGVPSLTELWLGALLRLAAMFFINLAGLLGMRVSRLPGECHTDATPQALPLEASDPATEETGLAAASSHKLPIALMLGSELGRCSGSRRVYPELVEGSKHEGVLTARRHKPIETHRDSLDLPPPIPANVRSQRVAFAGRPQGLSRLRAAAAHPREDSRNLSRPARTRISGHIAPI